MEPSPLVVIVGPTASGKTALAISIALRFGGEIICADSRTVYKGMDVGTAKPTQDEQALVPHWGLDLVEPNQRFTAAHFQSYAKAKIEEIRSRGHIPLLVGGSGLYIDSVVFNYEFGPDRTIERRRELEKYELEELINYCRKNNVILPENHKNKRYIVRAIEQNTINNRRRQKPLENSIIVGIATDTDILKSRIQQRAEQLFADGVVEEAVLLGKKYGWDSESMTGNIYPLVRRYLIGELSLPEMQQLSATRDWQLARRQLTWLKRNPFINWYDLNEAEQFLISTLENPAES